MPLKPTQYFLHNIRRVSTAIAISLLYLQKLSRKRRTNFVQIFVLRKKGSKTKKRMKEEEIEKGNYGPTT